MEDLVNGNLFPERYPINYPINDVYYIRGVNGNIELMEALLFLNFLFNIKKRRYSLVKFVGMYQ